MGWDKAQIRTFIKQVRKDAGEFWNFVTPEIREALVARRAMFIITGQASETQKTAAIEELYNAMLKEAGLLQEEPT